MLSRIVDVFQQHFILSINENIVSKKYFAWKIKYYKQIVDGARIVEHILRNLWNILISNLCALYVYVKHKF